MSRRSLTVLARHEVAALLNAVESPRYRAILMLTYGAGLRVGEVVRLRPEDVDEDRGILRVGEGDGREVMLSSVALQAVRAYRHLHSSPRWLFLGARPGEHLSRRSVQRAFAQARSKAGLPSELRLFNLRDSFAAHLVENGIGLRHVQALLGHTSPRMTRVYDEVVEAEPTAIPSPLDQLEGLVPPG